MNKQVIEKKVVDLSEQSKRIQKMKFCIISSYNYERTRNDLLNFTLEYKH